MSVKKWIFLLLVRHLWQTSGWLLQYTPLCYNKLERNTDGCLEADGILPNFAVSERQKNKNYINNKKTRL